jgi:hypothetical protein
MYRVRFLKEAHRLHKEDCTDAEAFYSALLLYSGSICLRNEKIRHVMADPANTKPSQRGRTRCTGSDTSRFKATKGSRRPGSRAGTEDFHGKSTSNGERYDMNAMTAAHKTLPLGVYVR